MKSVEMVMIDSELAVAEAGEGPSKAFGAGDDQLSNPDWPIRAHGDTRSQVHCT